MIVIFKEEEGKRFKKVFYEGDRTFENVLEWISKTLDKKKKTKATTPKKQHGGEIKRYAQDIVNKFFDIK